MNTAISKSRKKGVTGKSLAPDPDKLRPLVTEKRWYWIGALPGLPEESVTIAGYSFPKMTERVSKDPNVPGRTKRAPKIGALAHLSREDVLLMEERLPWRVIRFNHTKEEDARLRAVERSKCKTDAAARTFDPLPDRDCGLEVLDVVRRKGRPVRMPTPAELKEAKENGINLRPYTPDPKDDPLANYLFAVPCANQDHPSRGEYYPECLEVTRFEWPDGMKE